MKSRPVVAAGVCLTALALIAGCGGGSSGHGQATSSPGQYDWSTKPASVTNSSESTSPSGRSLREIAATFSKACRGGAVPESARYAGHFHPLVIIGESQWASNAVGQYNMQPLPGLRPASRADVQLVACVTYRDSWHDCGMYYPSSGSQPNVQPGDLAVGVRIYTVRIVESATGKQLSQRVFGTPPTASSCGSSYSPPEASPPYKVLIASEDVLSAHDPVETYFASVVAS